MRKKDNIIVGLDIGTTKICTVVANKTEEGPQIIGLGLSPSLGLKKGVVVNLDATIESIQRSVKEAELMAGVRINTVTTGLSGGHIYGFNSHGMVAVKGKEVKKKDVKKAIEAAKAVPIPLDREIIHVIPQEFIVDSHSGIKEPLGMAAVRLETNVHIVTASVTSAQNIVKSANKAGLTVSDIVLQQIASSEAVLTPEEKELGVLLIDIGGGTTDIAIFYDGALMYTEVIPIGGNHINNDIAIGLRTPTNQAEKLKIEHGAAKTTSEGYHQKIEVPGVGGRAPSTVDKKVLAEIIGPRVTELFQLIKRDLELSGFGNFIASGAVLTGGTSMLQGIEDVAENILSLPVRRGIPRGFLGLNDALKSPIYSTGIGLILYTMRKAPRPIFRIRSQDTAAYYNFFDRMSAWFKDFV